MFPKKKRKKEKKCVENNIHVPLHDCMQKKEFHFKSRFHNHKLDACHIFISFIRKLTQQQGGKQGKCHLKSKFMLFQTSLLLLSILLFVN